MYGYKITLDGLPETLFACSTTVNDYSWNNNNNDHTIEFAVSKAKEFTTIVNKTQSTFENTFLFSCVAGNEDRQSYCKPDTSIEITSVAVSFKKLNIKAAYLTKADAFDKSCFVISAISLDKYENAEYERILNKYINSSVSDIPCDRANCISLWFELLYKADKYTRQALTLKSNSSYNYYVKKIDYLIENNYAHKMSLAEIAREFGVSYSYLSNTYSKYANQSFKKAFHTKRMEKAKELILTTEMSISDVAESTGFCDEIYLRKAFKSYWGVSISEYKKINKGLTLYHDKPLRKE